MTEIALLAIGFGLGFLVGRLATQRQFVKAAEQWAAHFTEKNKDL